MLRVKNTFVSLFLEADDGPRHATSRRAQSHCLIAGLGCGSLLVTVLAILLVFSCASPVLPFPPRTSGSTEVGTVALPGALGEVLGNQPRLSHSNPTQHVLRLRPRLASGCGAPNPEPKPSVAPDSSPEPSTLRPETRFALRPQKGRTRTPKPGEECLSRATGETDQLYKLNLLWQCDKAGGS